MILIDTINEDTEVPDLEEGSSDEELVKNDEVAEEEIKKKVSKKTKEKVRALPKKKKKESDFSTEFTWDDDGGLNEAAEDFEIKMKSMSRGKARLEDNTSEKLTALANEVEIDEESEAEECEEVGEDDVINDGETAEQSSSAEKSKFFTAAPEQDMNIKFSEMNLSRPLLKGVAALGFAHPTPIQASAIPLALLGKDLCACAVTGSGKTAAYVLPILERLLYKPKCGNFTRVLILVPTRELGMQVNAVLNLYRF